jgi:hypothetical protein
MQEETAPKKDQDALTLAPHMAQDIWLTRYDGLLSPSV